ncbi:MAG: peptidylprolyl isomerase [Spiribacter sp.]|jgi:peptidyl-prolyl cis-trans isomerase SurA|nr:peptidylprolyl isomerase [Spiribacter sp.]MDR9489535.1 peptidylprolyl isomerase [Spiribacter sp.]
MIRTLLITLSLAISVNVVHAEEVLLERIVALVNDDVVLASELEAEIVTVERELQQRNIRTPPRDELTRQVLERLVMQTLQLNVAERRGIRVDSATLDAAVRRVAERNGMSLTGLRDALEQEGLAMNRFRDQLRREIILTRLREQEMDRRVDVTDPEIEQFIERNREQTREYALSQILIGIPEAASPEAIAEAQVDAKAVKQRLESGESFARVAAASSDARNALEGGDLGWRNRAQLPRAGAEAIIALTPGETTPILRTPAGFQIYQLRDVRDTSEQMIEQAQIRHILIQTNEVVTNADAELRLEALRNRIQRGRDFAELARANSDDVNTANRGGELGWVNVDNLPPNFREPIEALAVGELSTPFRTGAGWHLAEVLERRKRDASEEIAREQAAEAIRQRKSEEETELWLRELREQAYVEIRLTGL